MIAFVVAILAALAVIVIVNELVRRSRSPKIAKVRLHKRRQPELEDYVESVLKGLKHGFGDVFVSYEVWKMDRETRLNLRAAPKWKRLSELSRSQIIRQIWRALEQLTGSAVVIVDAPAQRWSREIDVKFDHGPFGIMATEGFVGATTAPQFFKDT